MTASAMDQQITLQSFTTATDRLGGKARAWANYAEDATPWADVKARALREATAEGGVSASGTYVFKIYNRTDIKEADRIIWGGEYFNIRGIRREGVQSLFLLIDAERGVAS
jgi:SPP1 family predicted phage head-tail adaptor